MQERTRWVFGYGSPTWRRAFPHAECRAACLRGGLRRFWRGSPDRRGGCAAPGAGNSSFLGAAVLRDMQLDDAHAFAVAELLAES